ncbi:MAG: hypothetical protein AB7L13_20695 [Acidimicrobiia bacterium]
MTDAPRTAHQLPTLADAVICGSAMANIYHRQRHTVTDDASNRANSALGGETYTLTGGGTPGPARPDWSGRR